MIRHILPIMGQTIHDLTPRQKQILLAGTDALIGGACIAAAVAGVSSPAATVLHGFVGCCTAGAASLASGLNRTKLNTFLHKGMLATFAFACLMSIWTALILLRHDHLAWVSVSGLVFLAAFAGVLLSRAMTLHAMLWLCGFRNPPLRVLIYGAGSTGQQLCAALRAHDRIDPVAFVDDDPSLYGASISGLRVHSPDQLRHLATRHRIERVLLAMPSLPNARKLRLAHLVRIAGLEVQSLPSFAQLVGAEDLTRHLTHLDAGDLLGRTQLAWDLDTCTNTYRDKVVMVTGAGGSVGSELCRQLMTLGPRKLILFDVSELALYAINLALTAQAQTGATSLVPILGSVADAHSVRHVIMDHGVEIVLHAAAYKHVPLVEANPLAGLANNVLGTCAVAEAALAAGIERFILISTDKAVRPTNVMGASKRLAELVVQDCAKRTGKTMFSLVRFGNVMESSGSVVPLFRDQIASGGPVTLTHEDVTRYFMTLHEAATLVLFAGSLDHAPGAGTGNIYVLDMSAPLRIRDVARQMVAAAGLTVRDAANPDGDIEICVTGLRAGEKLHEEPLIHADMTPTPHHKILRAKEPAASPLELARALYALRGAIAAGDADLARLIAQTASEPQHRSRPDTAPHHSVPAQALAMVSHAQAQS